MKLNLENFNIRRSEALIAGSYSLPNNIERYTVKAKGLIGLDVYKDDTIKVNEYMLLLIWSCYMKKWSLWR